MFAKIVSKSSKMWMKKIFQKSKIKWMKKFYIIIINVTTVKQNLFGVIDLNAKKKVVIMIYVKLALILIFLQTKKKDSTILIIKSRLQRFLNSAMVSLFIVLRNANLAMLNQLLVYVFLVNLARTSIYANHASFQRLLKNYQEEIEVINQTINLRVYLSLYQLILIK